MISLISKLSAVCVGKEKKLLLNRYYYLISWAEERRPSLHSLLLLLLLLRDVVDTSLSEQSPLPLGTLSRFSHQCWNPGPQTESLDHSLALYRRPSLDSSLQEHLHQRWKVSGRECHATAILNSERGIRQAGRQQ